MLYRDLNCDGVLNGKEAAATISNMNFGVSAGEQFCLINKVFAASNLPQGARYRATTQATFTYAGGTASPLTLITHDMSIVGGKVSPSLPQTTTNPVTEEVGESRLVLRKTVENMSQGGGETVTSNQAKPGDFLVYRVYYRNAGTGPITDLKVNDTVPDFTHYVLDSAKCVSEPAGLSCTPTINGPYLKWLFTGSLLGGAQGSVSYEVMVDK